VSPPLIYPLASRPNDVPGRRTLLNEIREQAVANGLLSERMNDGR